MAHVGTDTRLSVSRGRQFADTINKQGGRLTGHNIMVYSKRKIPAHVVAKADGIIERYHSREIHAVRHNSGRGESIAVGNKWRLYRKDVTQDFELMSHERYNKFKDQKCQKN